MTATITNKLMLGTYDCIFKAIMLNPENSDYLQKIGASLYITNRNYLDTKQIIQINFDNFSYFKGNQEIYKFLYKEEKSNIILPENTIKYHVDLEYIFNKCYNKPVENLIKFERCCLLLMAETKEFALKIAGNDKVMKKVYEKLENLNSDEQIIGLYDAEKEEERIRQTQILGAKREGQKEK